MSDSTYKAAAVEIVRNLQDELAERDKAIEEQAQRITELENCPLMFHGNSKYKDALRHFEISKLEAGAQAIIDATHKAYEHFDLSEYYKAKLFVTHMRNTAKELRQKAQELRG